MLRFRLFGVPVGVHLTFLFLVFLPVLWGQRLSASRIAAWGVAVFLAVLVHELGHALTARAFDARGVNVTLYGLGGVTTYRYGPKGMSHGRSFFVSAAGSFVGIVLGGLVAIARSQGLADGLSPELDYFLESFVFTALVWGVLNWVPIVPLDGGHMVESLAAMVNEERAPVISQVVTWVAVAIVVPLALLNGYQFAAILVVLFALAGIRETRSKERARAQQQAATATVDAEGSVVADESDQSAPTPTALGDRGDDGRAEGSERPQTGEPSASDRTSPEQPDFPI